MTRKWPWVNEHEAVERRGAAVSYGADCCWAAGLHTHTAPSTTLTDLDGEK